MMQRNSLSFSVKSIVLALLFMSTQILGVPILGLFIGLVFCVLFIVEGKTDEFICIWLVLAPFGFLSYSTLVISLKEVFSLGVILLSFSTPSLFQYQSPSQKRLGKYLAVFIVFLYLYSTGHEVRGILLHFKGVENFTSANAISTAIKGVIFYYAVYKVSRRLIVSNTTQKTIFFYAVVIGCSLVFVGQLFPSFFFSTNTAIRMVDDISIVNENTRLTPLWGLYGGANTQAAYMALVVVLILVGDVLLKRRMVFLLVLFVSIFMTLSRTGIGAIGLVLFFSLIGANNNTSRRNRIFIILIAGSIIFVVFSNQLDLVIERFAEVSDEMDRNSDYYGRAAILYEYIQYLKDNPLYYLTGAIKELDAIKVPHNMFVTSIYYNGIIPLVFLLISLIGILKNIKADSVVVVISLLSVFLLTEYFHSEIGESFAFIFMISIYKDYSLNEISHG